MSPYPSEGSLTTDVREIGESETWDTQTDWEAYQSKNATVISNGVVMLEEQSEIPDSVVSLYEYEDDSDTTTAIDSKGSNDATVNGPTFSTTSTVGSLALSHDGTDDSSTSQNSVDLSAQGDTDGLSIAAHLRPSDTTRGVAIAWYVDGNNWFLIRIDSGGTWSAWLRVGGTNVTLDNTQTPDTSAYHHLYAEATQSNLSISVDETEIASTSHSLDVTAMGSGQHVTGYRPDASDFYYAGLVDDFAPATDPLTSDELNTLATRGN